MFSESSELCPSKIVVPVRNRLWFVRGVVGVGASVGVARAAGLRPSDLEPGDLAGAGHPGLGLRARLSWRPRGAPARSLPWPRGHPCRP